MLSQDVSADCHWGQAATTKATPRLRHMLQRIAQDTLADGALQLCFVLLAEAVLTLLILSVQSALLVAKVQCARLCQPV